MKPSIRDKDCNLGVEHLQLPTRATNSLHANGILRIGVLIERQSLIDTDRIHLGEGNRVNVQRAIRLIKEVADEGGAIDWCRYWTQAPWGINHLAFTCDDFERIIDSEKSLSIRTLHLDKAVTALEANGITNINLLLDHLRQGLHKLPNFGSKAYNEVKDTVIALSKCVQHDGHINWACFSSLLNIKMLPEVPWKEHTPLTLIQYLPQLAEDAVSANFEHRELTVLRKRVLTDPENRPTLEEMGEVFGGITRERIRQLQEDCLNLFRLGMLQNDYRGAKARFRSEIAEPFHEAKAHFESIGLPAWRKSQWVDELAKLWEVPTSIVNRESTLLSEILDFEEHTPDHRCLETVIMSRSTSKIEAKKTIKVIDEIHQVLSETPAGLDVFDLTSRLIKRLGKVDSPSIDELPVFAQLTSSTVCIKQELYRCAFHLLSNRADQAYRILGDLGRPCHGSDITRELNKMCAGQGEAAISDRTLTNAMSKDRRFMPIGKSGLWSLTAWGIEGRSIVELIEEALHHEGAPMTKEGIFEMISSKRPMAFASIALLLENNPDRFIKAGWNLWGLVGWRDLTDYSSNKNLDLDGFIDRFFRDLQKSRVEFSELRKELETLSGMPSKSAQGVLSFHPALDVERPDSRTRIAIYRPDWRLNPKQKGQHRERQPSVSNRICGALRELLNAEPTHELLLVEAVSKVTEHVGTTKPSVYAAISQSDEFEAINVESKVFKILRFAAGAKPDFPQIRLIKNGQWAAELERAVRKLTVMDVDVAIFMLGRQFDVAMKALVTSARERGMPPVTKDDDKSLSSRIDWALRNDFLHNAVTVKLLREERNARAHDEAPPVEQRERMIKDAPFLAGLYLNALIDIEGHL